MIDPKLNVHICEALGLDPTKVRCVTITAMANEAVVVTVEQFAPQEDGTRLLELIRRYTMVPRDG